MNDLRCACTPLHFNQTELKVREILEDRWRKRNHVWESDITNACQSSSSALLGACSLTLLIIQDKFQLDTLKAFWFWCSYFSLCLCMLNVTHTLFRLTNAFSLQCFQRVEKEEWQLRINAFFIIIDSFHFSAGSQSNLCLNISSLPLGTFSCLDAGQAKSNLNITGN